MAIVSGLTKSYAALPGRRRAGTKQAVSTGDLTACPRWWQRTAQRCHHRARAEPFAAASSELATSSGNRERRRGALPLASTAAVAWNGDRVRTALLYVQLVIKWLFCCAEESDLASPTIVVPPTSRRLISRSSMPLKTTPDERRTDRIPQVTGIWQEAGWAPTEYLLSTALISFAGLRTEGNPVLGRRSILACLPGSAQGLPRVSSSRTAAVEGRVQTQRCPANVPCYAGRLGQQDERSLTSTATTRRRIRRGLSWASAGPATPPEVYSALAAPRRVDRWWLRPWHRGSAWLPAHLQSFAGAAGNPSPTPFRRISGSMSAGRPRGYA